MMPSEKSLCIVIHDVAPATWDACRWLLDRVTARGPFPVTLLAVPRYHAMPRNAGFERWLCERSRGGDEIALHGFDHLDHGQPATGFDRLRRGFYTRGEGEFAAIDFEAATRRIQAGRTWLAELGLRPAGFVAPAWLLGREAWRALRAQPFLYTCTLRRIHLLGTNRGAAGPRSLVCQSQVYSSSSAWRRSMSVAWNESLAWCQRASPIVRLELHPGDDRPVVSRSWQHLLETQAAVRRVCTLHQVVASFRTDRVPTTP